MKGRIEQGRIEQWMLSIILDFIGMNWTAFESHCDDFNVDPEEIYQGIGGESD